MWMTNLASLALQRVFLILVFGMVVLRFAAVGLVLLDMAALAIISKVARPKFYQCLCLEQRCNLLHVMIHSLLIHRVQRIQGELDVSNERIASRT